MSVLKLRGASPTPTALGGMPPGVFGMMVPGLGGAPTKPPRVKVPGARVKSTKVPGARFPNRPADTSLPKIPAGPPIQAGRHSPPVASALRAKAKRAFGA